LTVALNTAFYHCFILKIMIEFFHFKSWPKVLLLDIHYTDRQISIYLLNLDTFFMKIGHCTVHHFLPPIIIGLSSILYTILTLLGPEWMKIPFISFPFQRQCLKSEKLSMPRFEMLTPISTEQCINQLFHAASTMDTFCLQCCDFKFAE
jgi:hypothetical protein